MKSKISMVLFAAIAGAAIQAHSMFVRSSADDAISPGVNRPIAMLPIHELPEWTRGALAGQLAAAYQVHGAVADLNRDGRPEILLAAAPPSPDLYIPERPVSVLMETEAGWTERRGNVHCRPFGFGAFRHQDWWDIRCREGLREQVLRWDGERYRPGR